MGHILGIPKLRTWQKFALQAWERNSFRGIFEVATGGGKTTFAIAARERLLESSPDVRTTIVVPTKALLDQWLVELTETAGILESDIKILTGRSIVPNKTVNLVIINTARGFENLTTTDGRNLLIVDECHRAGSPENAKSLCLPNCASIGLSATPNRDYDEGLEEHLIPSLGPILYRYTLADAIEDGVLSQLKLIYVKIPLLPSEHEKYEALTRRIAAALSNEDLEGVETLLRTRSRLYNNAFYRLPTARSLLDQRRGRRAIVFLESIDAANLLYSDLDSDQHSVTIYHSALSSGLRRSNLRLFRRGAFDVLITCRALDEGFNVPEAELAVIAAGTSSSRQRTQRVGRVLRTIGNKAFGEVITLYATPVEERRLIEEAQSMGLSAQTQWRQANVS
jgi:superfamily II DNA or RNA helicase